MCLKTFDKVPSIAEKDITVYKVLIVKEENGKTTYWAPFRDNFQYILGGKYGMAPNKTLKTKYNEYYEVYHVCEGFHAFRDMENAYDIAKPLRCVVVKATIPKGAEYLTDIDTISIVSNKLDLSEEVYDPRMHLLIKKNVYKPENEVSWNQL